jgi:hypothetical protein
MNENIEVKNLVDTKYGYVNCEINHETYGWIPFTATQNDVELFGRELFAAIKNGEHGDVAPYVEYVLTYEDKAKLIRVERDLYLEEIDNFTKNPLRWDEIVEADKNELKLYRLDLLDVPQQSDFPETIEWPVKPTIIE